jgi:hypothetical protein
LPSNGPRAGHEIRTNRSDPNVRCQSTDYCSNVPLSKRIHEFRHLQLRDC